MYQPCNGSACHSPPCPPKGAVTWVLNNSGALCQFPCLGTFKPHSRMESIVCSYTVVLVPLFSYVWPSYFRLLDCVSGLFASLNCLTCACFFLFGFCLLIWIWCYFWCIKIMDFNLSMDSSPVSLFHIWHCSHCYCHKFKLRWHTSHHTDVLAAYQEHITALQATNTADSWSGQYGQVPGKNLKEGDEWKRAFHATRKYYKYLVMIAIYMQLQLWGLPTHHSPMRQNNGFVQATFEWLKQSFTSTLFWDILIQISNLLWKSTSQATELFPCAFLLWNVTCPETNYNVRNRELLVIKPALEEWIHWLEGARYQFQVITDHKNL